MSHRPDSVQREIEALRQRGATGREFVDGVIDAVNEAEQRGIVDFLEPVLEAVEEARRIGYRRGEAYALAYAGYSRFLHSEYEKAVDDLHTSLAMIDEIGDRGVQARVLGALAMTYRSLGNFEEALRLGFRSLQMNRQAGNRYAEAWTLNGIGGGYHDLGDFERSLEYHRLSRDVFTELEYELGIARAETGLGKVYQSLGQLDRARTCQERSLEVYRRLDNDMGESRALNDLGELAMARGDLDTARGFHEQSLAIRRRIGARQAAAMSLINLGKLFVAQADPASALEVLHEALSIVTEIGSKPRIVQAHRTLADAYEAAGDFGKALEHFRLYHRTHHEILGEETNARIKNLQVGFEVERAEKEAEIERLRSVELKEKNDQLEQLLADLKSTQTQLIQSEKMAALGSLVAGVVHELNSPVGAINGNTDVLDRSVQAILERLKSATSLEEFVNDSRVTKALDMLDGNIAVTRTAARRITRIMNSLKTFTQLDGATIQRVDVHDGLESALTLIETQYAEHIGILREFGDLPKIRCYPGELNQVFMNLLTNAVQAIDGPGTVTVKTYRENGRVCVSVIDSGRGIAKDQMAGLFEPRFSRTGERVKAGIGLFTAYNIVQKHDGSIEVDSSPGKGTSFTIKLPIA